MNEYDLKKALARRSEKLNTEKSAAAPDINGIPNSVLTEVLAGKREATSDMMGHREELAPSIAAKMSQAFGMDFSAVKVYRSDVMDGTEMHGMAQGNRVILSSDVDLNTMEGQAVLGHELSHVRAQSMGIGSGRGLLSDAALEHQADTEGLLAARGMNISGESMGMSTGFGMAGVEGLSPIGAGLGASAGAPMQADKGESGPKEPESFLLRKPSEADRHNSSKVSKECEQYVRSHSSEDDYFNYRLACRMANFINDDNRGVVSEFFDEDGYLVPIVLKSAFSRCWQMIKEEDRKQAEELYDNQLVWNPNAPPK